MAQHRGRPADLARWITERDRIYEEITERGWSPKREAFVQNYANEVLDEPLADDATDWGFVAPRDPMWLSTLRAMDKELVSDSLVYRATIRALRPMGYVAQRGPSPTARSGTLTR